MPQIEPPDDELPDEPTPGDESADDESADDDESLDDEAEEGDTVAESDDPTGDGRPEGVIVVSTAESDVRFAIRDEVTVPEGMVCLGVYLGERLIAQDARPAEVADRLVQYGGGSAKLVYATAPDGAGLTGYLYALLPAEGLAELLSDLADEGDEGEEAPWSASARAYEATVEAMDDEDEDADEDDELDSGDEDEADEEDEGTEQVLVPLGAIKRVYRSHPNSVEAEAADVLAHIVAGEVTTVDAQTVDQFLKGL